VSQSLNAAIAVVGIDIGKNFPKAAMSVVPLCCDRRDRSLLHTHWVCTPAGFRPPRPEPLHLSGDGG
jgi:hypothetical protein